MIRVAFDVEDVLDDVDRIVPMRVEQHAAAYRAVGAYVARDAGCGEFEMSDGRYGFVRGKTHHGHARCAYAGGTELEKLATGYSHGHGYLLVISVGKPTDVVDCLTFVWFRFFLV